MIEIVYKDSRKKDGSVLIVKPPKNIRQIGSPGGRHKIYLEDYVYTFLHSAAFGREFAQRAAVLIGRSEVSQDIRYTFISGAISCEEFVLQESGIVFDEDCWEYIYKEIKQYFDHLEVVGWFLSLPGSVPKLTTAMEAAHRKYFTGRDKVLFLLEPSEGDDVLYAYEQGIFQKKSGYYIYYEKNLAMQEYMVSAKEKEAVREAPSEAEAALQSYRSILLEKNQKSGQRRMKAFLYTAASAAMVALCVMGITMVNNYDKMKRVEETLFNAPAGVVVDSVPVDITPASPADTLPSGQEEEPEAEDYLPTDGNQADRIHPQDKIHPPTEEIEEQPLASIQRYLDQGYYIVQPGDKLELICRQFYSGTDAMDEIIELNRIADVDKILVGQKILLP